MNPRRTCVALILLLLLSLNLGSVTKAPLAARKPDSVFIHNKWLFDNYSWLKDRNKPAVRKHLKKENNYAKTLLKPARPFINKVYQEFLSRLKETEVTQPYFYKGYYYYTRYKKGKP